MRALAALATAVALLGASAPGSSAAPAVHKVPLWERGGVSGGLAYDAAIKRLLGNISSGQNVAVFMYQVPGEAAPRTLAAESVQWTKGGGVERGEGHSETRLDHIFRQWGVDPAWVIAIYSEREPCTLPGHNCKGLIETMFPNLRALYWSLHYPYTTNDKGLRAWVVEKAARARSGRILKKKAKALLSGGHPSSPVMNPGGRKQRGPLPVLADEHFMPQFMPGGIDFSTLELRYVADTGRAGRRSLSYAFRGRMRPAPSDAALGVSTSLQASDAFFVWLALPPRSFWVNLNPSEPNRIIDPQFARSDAGRVLLESDLLMKKVVAPLVHPDSATGAAFWQQLFALYGGDRPDVTPCMSFRQWIVPAPATVHATARELYILDAPLEVKMESQYLGGDTASGECPMDAPALNAAKQELYRRLILPHVQTAVNTHAAYAPLRRVYLSRIAAEWFRQRASRRRTALDRIADSGRIDRWIARPAWNPIDVFNRYVASVRDGEFKVQRPSQHGNDTYTRFYVYGGVDFSQTPARNVDAAQFEARFPALGRRVRRSLRRPALDAQRGELWVGGTSGGR